MNLVALKMLVGDRMKYFALIAGVAFASLLITQQASIFTGYALRTGAWIRETGYADLWVMDEQVEHTVDIKRMGDMTLSRVRGVEGVAWAAPMYYGFLNVVLPDGSRQNFRIIGIDDATLAGAPPTMVEGQYSDLRRDRAVIMNHAANVMLDRFPADQRRYLRVGDRVSVNDNEVEIVGSYASSPEFFWEPIFYTTYSRAIFMSPTERKNLQYILVKLREGVDARQVAGRINALGGVRAMTGREFENQTMWWILVQTGILVNFGITIALGFVIGMLVAGQTFYTFILDNLRNFGALKAMGVGNGRIVMMMATQVVVVALLGYGIGVGLASLTGAAFSGVGLAFQMPWQIPAGGFLAVGGVCMLAGVLSMMKVMRLEPGVVFR
jgi:putative ABC transport system permease protein